MGLCPNHGDCVCVYLGGGGQTQSQLFSENHLTLFKNHPEMSIVQWYDIDITCENCSKRPFQFVKFDVASIWNCQFAKRLQNACLFRLLHFCNSRKYCPQIWNETIAIGLYLTNSIFSDESLNQECKVKCKKMQALLNIRRLRAKLFEYNKVGIRYVDPLKVAPKLVLCRDKHAQIFCSLFSI